jgi:hypothetical protein
MKIHALVDADGRPVKLELTAGQAADAPMAEKLPSDLQPAQRSWPIRHMIPTQFATSPSNANAGRTFLQKPIANRPSASAVGSIVSLISSSGSSIVANRCAAWPLDMIDALTTTLSRSSSLRQGYGLHHLMGVRFLAEHRCDHANLPNKTTEIKIGCSAGNRMLQTPNSKSVRMKVETAQSNI